MERNRILALLLLGLVTVYGLAIDDITLDFWADDEVLNARTLPIFLSAGLGSLALILLVTGGGGRIERPQWQGLARLAAMMVLMWLFAAALEFAGFWIAGGAFLGAGLLIMGERRPLLLVGLPLGAIGIAWLLLIALLDVYLPPGVLWERC